MSKSQINFTRHALWSLSHETDLVNTMGHTIWPFIEQSADEWCIIWCHVCTGNGLVQCLNHPAASVAISMNQLHFTGHGLWLLSHGTDLGQTMGHTIWSCREPYADEWSIIWYDLCMDSGPMWCLNYYTVTPFHFMGPICMKFGPYLTYLIHLDKLVKILTCWSGPLLRMGCTSQPWFLFQFQNRKTCT